MSKQELAVPAAGVSATVNPHEENYYLDTIKEEIDYLHSIMEMEKLGEDEEEAKVKITIPTPKHPNFKLQPSTSQPLKPPNFQTTKPLNPYTPKSLNPQSHIQLNPQSPTLHTIS
jgi:hypothetical protein